MGGVSSQVARNGSLSRLLGAYLLVTVAEYGQWIAILVYAYERGGAGAAGLAAIIQLIPALLLAPLISAHLARFGAIWLLRRCYAVETVMLAGCGAAILSGAPAILVYAAAVGFVVPIGVSRSLHNALMPLVVRRPDELTAANVATNWCSGAAMLIGPALAGLLITIDGPGLACAGLAAVCIPAPLLAAVRPVRASAQESGGEDAGGGIADLLAAVREIAARPATRALMAYPVGAAIIEGAIDLLAVLLAVKVLTVGPGAAGYLSAAFGAGGLLGGFAAVLLVGRRLAGPLAIAALAGGAALAALSFVSMVVVAALLLAAVGASRAIQTVAAQTLLQRTTPLEVIVCAFVLLESVSDIGLAVGSLLVPVLVGLGGVKAAFVGIASVGPLIVLATAGRIRRIDEDATIPIVEMAQLRNVNIFAALPAAPLEMLAQEAEHVDVPQGKPIISEGEAGERYYVITSGAVRVTQGAEELRRMGPGEGFGEIALLHEITRTATVTATADTSLLAVGREAFLTALHANVHVHREASAVASDLLGAA